jgi:periplasmic divalent cation tolerance protein
MTPLFVYITAPDGECARTLVRTLVEERLCAGANILGGMESFYWWQGEVKNARESVCVVKTTDASYPALEKRVCELHPHVVPCIVALRPERGFPAFLHWIAEETRS